MVIGDEARLAKCPPRADGFYRTNPRWKRCHLIRRRLSASCSIANRMPRSPYTSPTASLTCTWTRSWPGLCRDARSTSSRRCCTCRCASRSRFPIVSSWCAISSARTCRRRFARLPRGCGRCDVVSRSCASFTTGGRSSAGSSTRSPSTARRSDHWTNSSRVWRSAPRASAGCATTSRALLLGRLRFTASRG